jgi:hypothetical protein
MFPAPASAPPAFPFAAQKWILPLYAVNEKIIAFIIF